MPTWGASVCEALDHRLEYNGKEIEVFGRLDGGSYSGYFICGREHCDPCVNRWIFSWPSALGLNLRREGGVGWVAYLKEYVLHHVGGGPINIVAKGRLVTGSDYYVVNLPWREGRPLGRYSYGGVAAAIVVSDI